MVLLPQSPGAGMTHAPHPSLILTTLRELYQQTGWTGKDVCFRAFRLSLHNEAISVDSSSHRIRTGREDLGDPVCFDPSAFVRLT